MSKIFVTGGSGFVGSAVIDALITRGHTVHALVSQKPVADRGGAVRPFPGGLFDPAALDAGTAGCDAVVHLVGIVAEKPSAGVTFDRMHRQGTEAVLAAAKRAGVSRYVHMSALGARPNAVSEYHRTKWSAEELVRASGLGWTIVRPSLIHGPGGEFTQMEVGWVTRRCLPYLFMPYFGTGALGLGRRPLVQPVFVDDVARAFADAVEKPEAVGQTYQIGGPDRMDWPAMHHAFAQILTGKSRVAIPVPAWYAKALTYVAPASLLPFNRAQVQMAEEDNVCDLAPFRAAFGWEPRSLPDTLRGYRAKLTGVR